jgi:hypothetical protein
MMPSMNERRRQPELGHWIASQVQQNQLGETNEQQQAPLARCGRTGWQRRQRDEQIGRHQGEAKVQELDRSILLGREIRTGAAPLLVEPRLRTLGLRLVKRGRPGPDSPEASAVL